MHQRHVDKAATRRCTVAAARLHWSVAEGDTIDAENWNVVFDDEVAHYRVRHMLRVGNAGLPACPRVALHLNDVTLLPLQLGSNIVQSRLGLCIQDRLTVAEINLSVRNRRILVEVRDRRIQIVCAGRSLLRHLRSLSRLRVCRGRKLVRTVSRGLRLLDAGRAARVQILDVVAVLRGELIQLIQPILHRTDLPVDPLLAGQRVQVAPEALIRLRRKRLAGGVGAIVLRILRRGGWLLLRVCRLGGRGLRGQAQRRRKEKGGHCAGSKNCRVSISHAAYSIAMRMPNPVPEWYITANRYKQTYLSIYPQGPL